MQRLYPAICIVLAILSSCKQTPFEEESTAKKINMLKRKDASDAVWSHVWAGKQVYETYCAGCHGIKGDGKGPANAMLATQPRNFGRGMFKLFQLLPVRFLQMQILCALLFVVSLAVQCQAGQCYQKLTA